MNFSLHQSPHRSLARALREERGTALVEFALVLPLFALILFGVLDFGKAYNYWIDETHLASEGARYATVDQNPDPSKGSNFLPAVQSQADTNELRVGNTASVPTPLQVCVSFPTGTHKVGDPVRVRVTTTYHFLPIFDRVLGGVLNRTVVADSTMRLERVPTHYADGDCA